MSGVTNEGRLVATADGEHVAVAMLPDVCRVPGTAAPVPAENSVSTERLQNGTSLTRLAGQPIWTRKGQLGPPSDPAHAGTLGGVVSGTYRAEAVASSWSADLVVEGAPVVRSQDTTFQNHHNTTGLVLPHGFEEGAWNDGAFVPEACRYLIEGSLAHDLPDLAALRGSHALGPPTAGSFRFPGDAAPRPSLTYAATVRGQPVDIVAPVDVADRPLPSPASVAAALALLPDFAVGSVHQVVLSPLQTPAEQRMRETGNLANAYFGRITFFQYESSDPEFDVASYWREQSHVDGVTVHEALHVFVTNVWQDPETQKVTDPSTGRGVRWTTPQVEPMKEWAAATRSDGRAPSSYAKTSPYEDLSDFMVLYLAASGTPCEAVMRRLFPARYAIMDKLVRS